MSPLNGLMNHVTELSNSENCFTRNISSRAAMILGGIPLELLAAIQNVISLPFQPIGICCKFSVKILNLCCGSQFLSDVEDSLPGIRQIFVTAYKIVAYTIGTIFTGILGLISPMANFRLHCALSLVRNEKEEAERVQANEEAVKQRELQEALMQAQIQTMLFAMRQKAAEQERLRAEEVKKEKENQKAVSKLAKVDNDKKQPGLSVRFMQDNLARDDASMAEKVIVSPFRLKSLSQVLNEANKSPKVVVEEHPSPKGFLEKVAGIFF